MSQEIRVAMEGPTTQAPGETAWRREASAFSDHDGGAATSAVSIVLRALLRKIDAGEYAPGKKINTVELASDLGLSRAPIREALHILAGKGIVTLLPDRGAILRPFSLERLIETIQALNALMRSALRQTALKIEEADNKAKIREHKANILRGIEEGKDFHFWLVIHEFLHDVARIGGNSVLEELILSLNLDLHARTFDHYIPVRIHIERYVDTFRRMADALIAGDWRSAEAVGDFHTEWQVEILRKVAQ